MARRYQSSIISSSHSWVLFAPSGSNDENSEKNFFRYCNRINSAKNRPLGDFPSFVALPGSDLGGVNFAGSNLRRADLSYANLVGAKFIGADLNQANLTAAYLSGAYFSAADLTGATLNDAMLHEASFVGAKLHGADFNNAPLEYVDFERAQLNGVDLSGARRLDHSRIINAQISEDTKLPPGFDDIKQKMIEELRRVKEWSESQEREIWKLSGTISGISS